jgi:copper homeostasis protein (lipoprotein)
MRFQKFFLLAFLAALSAPAPHAQTPAPADPFPLPSTFTATLPCADCPAIHESLTFLPGGIYLDHLVYEDHPHAFDSLGHWETSDDGSQLTLTSGSAASAYSIIDATHIKKIAPAGSNIPAAYLPTFTITSSPSVPTATLHLRGDYISDPNGSTFTECDSQIALIPLKGPVPLALEKAYASAHLEPGKGLFAHITGRLVIRKSSASSRPITLLEIQHFDRATSSESCATRPS